MTHQTGFVDLPSLQPLPEGIQLKNNGWAVMGAIIGTHLYRDQEFRFGIVDGYQMLFESVHSEGDVTIHSARFFSPKEISEMPKCFVAEKDGITAHGDTVESALQKLQSKLSDTPVKETGSTARSNRR